MVNQSSYPIWSPENNFYFLLRCLLVTLALLNIIDINNITTTTTTNTTRIASAKLSTIYFQLLRSS